MVARATGKNNDCHGLLPEEQADSQRQAQVTRGVPQLSWSKTKDSSAAEPVSRTWRAALYHFIEDPDSSGGAKAYSVCILTTIFVSIASFILETEPTIRHHTVVWNTIEIVCTLIFTVEYAVRLFVCDALGTQTRLEFIRNPMNVFDLLAIVPFYLEGASSYMSKNAKALRALRSVRLIRLFRIFKLGRYSSGLKLMETALRKSMEPLFILGCFLCIGVVLFSSLMFFAERVSCPDVQGMIAKGTFEAYEADCVSEGTGWTRSGELCCDKHTSALDFQSIPTTFWWALTTMTTVGYGDTKPRTWPGRLVGGVSMLCGIMLISLPVAIVGSKFQEAYLAYEVKRNDSNEQVADQATDHVPALRAKLTQLASSDMSVRAQEQIRAILDVFDQVDYIEAEREKLRRRDLALQATISCEVSAITEIYDGCVKVVCA